MRPPDPSRLKRVTAARIESPAHSTHTLHDEPAQGARPSGDEWRGDPGRDGNRWAGGGRGVRRGGGGGGGGGGGRGLPRRHRAAEDNRCEHEESIHSLLPRIATPRTDGRSLL